MLFFLSSVPSEDAALDDHAKFSQLLEPRSSVKWIYIAMANVEKINP